MWVGSTGALPGWPSAYERPSPTLIRYLLRVQPAGRPADDMGGGRVLVRGFEGLCSPRSASNHRARSRPQGKGVVSVARRQLLATAVGAALVLGPGSALVTPTAAAAPLTVNQQLHAAQQQVRSAHQQLDAVQVRAEQAAEAYNGARLRADQAAARSAAAAGVARAAGLRAARAVAAADFAAGEVRRAVGVRIRTRSEQGRAEQAVALAQARLGALAAGAYKSGGHLDGWC